MDRFFLVLTTVFLATCTTADNSLEHQFLVYEEDGITTAETIGGPKYSGELFEYIKVAEHQEDERAESILARPSNPQTDEHGNIYVPDSGDGRIAVFNSEGKYIYSFGRSGSGPGEFQFPAIQHIGNDQVEIFDRMQRRVTVFSTDGILISTISLPLGISRSVTSYWQATNGQYIGILHESSLQGERAERWASAIVYSSSGDSICSVTTPKLPGGKIYSFRINERMMGRGPAPYGYQSFPFASFNEHHGIILSTGRDPSLKLYSLDAELKLYIKLNLPSQPVTNRDKEIVLANQQRQIENASEENRERYQETYKNTEFAESKPYWSQIDVDDMAYIWLSVMPAPSEDDEVPPQWKFFVLSPEGEYLGSTIQPSAGKVRFGFLSGVKIDAESGLVTIEVYKVESKVAGLKYP